MPVPTYDQFIEPLLRYLAQRPGGAPTRDAQDGAAATRGLTEADREERLPSGTQQVYRNRIGWAHDRLKRAGYSSSPSRGFWQLDVLHKLGYGTSRADYGAIAGQRATKGVFITTSSYTPQSLDFARSVERIVLIDGERFADLMIDGEVGISMRPVKVPKLDSDYFDEE